MVAHSVRNRDAASAATLTAVLLEPRRARRSRRALPRSALTAVVGLLALLAVQLTMRSPAPSPPMARATVFEGSVMGTLPLAGIIERESTVRVGSGLPGQVVDVRTDVGARVERGQVLARLDNLEQRAALHAAD